eukprot:TRINITY_DN40801_c0_g1_i1.p1 TRINITY_DN40801_c0_g1~~TRINITY_DN40801_c0_g1_i1.p1  ORF type:complete len:684 (+),score=84.20 TRINITY_DN40801_c0_g1_i1:268-2052(+)
MAIFTISDAVVASAASLERRQEDVSDMLEALATPAIAITMKDYLFYRRVCAVTCGSQRTWTVGCIRLLFTLELASAAVFVPLCMMQMATTKSPTMHVAVMTCTSHRSPSSWQSASSFAAPSWSSGRPSTRRGANNARRCSDAFTPLLGYFDQVGISYYINTFALIILSGACRRMPEQEALAAEAEVERQRRRGEAALSYAACEDRIWQSQVEEMAHRAFTLQELLNFYSRLPVLMPHFDPQKHTTTDVVSGAIIPDSADLKSAYATRMMAGRCLRPNVMVTHNWGNLFRDLCAVMVAHALREPDFGLISHLLDSFDLKSVNELLTEDALAMTFWVCAFSVNQHRSICGRNPHKTTDTVTRNLHPLCPCGEKVYLNDTPPVRGDGKSVRCEMNKFDDMLAYLAASDPGFHHVIAVDRRFVLFSRAWCVAELAVGHQLGVKQQIIVFSPCSIVEHRSQLDGLRIQDMEASRPEDVSEILSKIPDADAFNQHLQQMLLGDRGLLVLWTSMDEFTMVARLGQVAHMAKTLRKALEDPLSRQCSWIRCASKGELGELGDEPLPTLLRIDPIQDKGATATFAASATKDCAVVGEDYKLSL